MKAKSKDMPTLSQARKGRCRDYNDDILLGNAKDDGIVQTTNRILVVKTIVVSNRSVAGSIPAVGVINPHTIVWGFSLLYGIIQLETNNSW